MFSVILILLVVWVSYFSDFMGIWATNWERPFQGLPERLYLNQEYLAIIPEDLYGIDFISQVTYSLDFIVDFNLSHLSSFYLKDNLENLIFLYNQNWVFSSLGAETLVSHAQNPKQCMWLKKDKYKILSLLTFIIGNRIKNPAFCFVNVTNSKRRAGRMRERGRENSQR